MTILTNADRTRYHRQMLLREWGEAGQEKLKKARGFIAGAGGLGSPVAIYLAVAGVGELRLCDSDVIELSNLNRQILHPDGRIGQAKVLSAEQTLSSLNPDITINKYEMHLNSENVVELFKQYDMVLDGCDNFATRYLVNDACVMLNIPNVHGSIYRFEGQATLFHPHNGPCYRCLYPEPTPPDMAPSCAEAGVLGVLPGMMGIIQATEAVKHILGQGKTLNGRLLKYDALDMAFKEYKLRRDPECPICGEKPTITKLEDLEWSCQVA